MKTIWEIRNLNILLNSFAAAAHTLRDAQVIIIVVINGMRAYAQFFLFVSSQFE